MDNLLFKSGNSGQVNIDEAQGIVECFVAGIGNKDSVGDVVISGAFAKSLTRRKPRVVWGHSWNDPIGKVLEMYEVPVGDSRLPVKMRSAGIGGLYAKVQFNLNSEKGKEAFATVAFFGEEQEWSIGYKTIDSVFDPNLQANILKEVELYEVSPVLHGANQLTGTISIKGDEKGHMPVIPMSGMGMQMMPEMPRIVVIASPQEEENRASEGNPFDEGMARELQQPDKMALQAELTERTGSKIEVMNATENSVVFRRTTADGKASMYRLPYHKEGNQYMFGKPEPYAAANPVPQATQNVEQKPGAPVVVPNGGIAYRTDDQAEMAMLFAGENAIQSPWGKSDVSHLIELPESYMASAKEFISPVLRHHKLQARPNAKGIIIDGLLTANALDALQNAVKALGTTIGQAGGNIGQAIGRIRDLAQTFNPYALDGDGDGFVQDGSAFMRPFIPIKKPGFDLPDVRGKKRNGDALLDKPRSAPKLPKDRNTWTRAQRNEALLAGVIDPETRDDVAFLANKRPDNEGLAKYWDMSEADLTKEGNRLVNARRQATGAEKDKIDQELLKVSHEFQRRASYAETFGQDFVPPAKREVPRTMVPEAEKPKPAKPKRTEKEGLASAGSVFDSITAGHLEEYGEFPEWDDLDEDGQLEFVKEIEYDYMYDEHGRLGDDGIVEALEDGDYEDEIREYAEELYDKIKAGRIKKRDEEDAKNEREENERYARSDAGRAEAAEEERQAREDAADYEREKEQDEELKRRARDRALDEQADAALDRAIEGYIEKYGEVDGFASSGERPFSDTEIMLEVAHRDGWRGGREPSNRSRNRAYDAINNWEELSDDEKRNLLPDDDPSLRDYVDALLKALDKRIAETRKANAARRNEERKRRDAERKLIDKFRKGDLSMVPFDPDTNEAAYINWSKISQDQRDNILKNWSLKDEDDIFFNVNDIVNEAFDEYGPEYIDDDGFASRASRARTREIRQRVRERNALGWTSSDGQVIDRAMVDPDDWDKLEAMPKGEERQKFIDKLIADYNAGDFGEITKRVKKIREERGLLSRGEGEFGSSEEDSAAAKAFDSILEKYWKMWGFDVPEDDEEGWDEPFGFASRGNDEEVQQSKLDELVGGVKDRLIAELETADPATWKPSWRNDSLPINPTTGKPYRGWNAFFLMLSTHDKQYKTGRFAGFNQLKARGAIVRKGEKGTPILRPQLVRKEDEDGNIKEFVVFRGATVFNIDQTDGGDDALRAIPADLPESERIAILDETLKELGVTVQTANMTPHYSPDGDYISMPDFAKGTSALEWTSTLAHEAVHWTGHKSRMDRASLRDYSSNKAVRAYEELVAEIGSAMLLAAHGIEAPFRQDHAPYIKGWIQLLKDDPEALNKAFKDAQAAVNFMLEKSPNLRRLFGGVDTSKKAPEVDAPDKVEALVGASEGFASLHRVRTPGSSALGGILYDDNSNELMVGFLKGKSWDDLSEGDRENWIERYRSARRGQGGYESPLDDTQLDERARDFYEDSRDIGWYVYSDVSMEEVSELAAARSKGRHINALKKLKKARKASDEDQFNFFGRDERVQDVKKSDGFASVGTMMHPSYTRDSVAQWWLIARSEGARGRQGGSKQYLVRIEKLPDGRYVVKKYFGKDENQPIGRLQSTMEGPFRDYAVAKQVGAAAARAKMPKYLLMYDNIPARDDGDGFASGMDLRDVNDEQFLDYLLNRFDPGSGIPFNIGYSDDENRNYYGIRKRSEVVEDFRNLLTLSDSELQNALERTREYYSNISLSYAMREGTGTRGEKERMQAAGKRVAAIEAIIERRKPKAGGEDGFASRGAKKLGVESRYQDRDWINRTQERILKSGLDFQSLPENDRIDWANSFLDEYLNENEMGHNLADVANGRRLNTRPDIDLLNYAEQAYARMSDAHMARRAQFGRDEDGFASVGMRTMRVNIKPSKAVDYVSYDPDSESLYVAYKREDGRGDMYVYEGVSMDEAIGVGNAESVGKAINDIKRSKNVRKATPDEVMSLAESERYTNDRALPALRANKLSKIQQLIHGDSRFGLGARESRIDDDEGGRLILSERDDTRLVADWNPANGEYEAYIERYDHGGREEPGEWVRDNSTASKPFLDDSNHSAMLDELLRLNGERELALDSDRRVEREIETARRELDMAGDAPGVESVDVTYSSALDAVDYNPSTQELRVTYKGGGTYVYEGVDRITFEEFKYSPSKGRAMNDIKRAHPYRKDSEWTGGGDEDGGIEEFDVRGSAAVEKVTYDPSKEELTVVYSGGKGYIYSGVTREEADAVRSAPSKGRAINDVKRTHDVRKIPTEVKGGPDLEATGWSKGDDGKWRKGVFSIVVLRDEEGNYKGLLATHERDGTKYQQEAHPDVSANDHLEDFEGILRGVGNLDDDDETISIDPAPAPKPRVPTRKPPRGGKRVRNRSVVIDMEQGTLDEIIEAEGKNITVDALRDAAGSPMGKYTKGPRKGKNRGYDTITVRDAETGELLHANEILLTSSASPGSPSAANRKRGYIRARSYAGRQDHNVVKDEGPSLRGEGRGMTDYDKRVYGLGSDEKNREAGLASRGGSSDITDNDIAAFDNLSPREQAARIDRADGKTDDEKYENAIRDYADEWQWGLTDLGGDEDDLDFLTQLEQERLEQEGDSGEDEDRIDDIDRIRMADEMGDEGDDGFASRGRGAGMQNFDARDYESSAAREIRKDLMGRANQDLGKEIVMMDDGNGNMVPTAVHWGSRPNSKGESAPNDWVFDFAPKGEWIEVGVGDSSAVKRVWIKRNNAIGGPGRGTGNDNGYFGNEVMVMFNNGRIYAYDDVIRPDLIGLLDAESMGRAVREITHPDGEARENFTRIGSLAEALKMVRKSYSGDRGEDGYFTAYPRGEEDSYEEYVAKVYEEADAALEWDKNDYDESVRALVEEGRIMGGPGDSSDEVEQAHRESYLDNFGLTEDEWENARPSEGLASRGGDDDRYPPFSPFSRGGRMGTVQDSGKYDTEYWDDNALDELNGRASDTTIQDKIMDAMEGRTYHEYGDISLPSDTELYMSSDARPYQIAYVGNPDNVDEHAMYIVPIRNSDGRVTGAAVVKVYGEVDGDSDEYGNMVGGRFVYADVVGEYGSMFEARKAVSDHFRSGDGFASRGRSSTKPTVDADTQREIEGATLGQLAQMIQDDLDEQGKEMYFGAVPYIEAMATLETMDDKYGYDDAESIVAYALGNLQTYKGPKARAIKAELKKRLDEKFKRNVRGGGFASRGGSGRRETVIGRRFSDEPVTFDRNMDQTQRLEANQWLDDNFLTDLDNMSEWLDGSEYDSEAFVSDLMADVGERIMSEFDVNDEQLRSLLYEIAGGPRNRPSPARPESVRAMDVLERRAKEMFDESGLSPADLLEEYGTSNPREYVERFLENNPPTKQFFDDPQAYFEDFSKRQVAENLFKYWSEANGPDEDSPFDLKYDGKNGEYIVVPRERPDGGDDDGFASRGVFMDDGIRLMRRGNRDFLSDEFSSREYRDAMSGLDKVRNNSGAELTTEESRAIRKLADLYLQSPATRGTQREAINDIVNMVNDYRLGRGSRGGFASRGRDLDWEETESGSGVWNAVGNNPTRLRGDSIYTITRDEDGKFGVDAAHGYSYQRDGGTDYDEEYFDEVFDTLDEAKDFVRRIDDSREGEGDDLTRTDDDGFASRSGRPLITQFEWTDFEDLNEAEQEQVVQDYIKSWNRDADPDFDPETARENAIDEFNRAAGAARREAAESLLAEIYDLWDKDADADNPFQRNGSLAYAEELIKNTDYVDDLDLAEARNIVDEVRERFEGRNRASDEDGFASRGPRQLPVRGEGKSLSWETSERSGFVSANGENAGTHYLIRPSYNGEGYFTVETARTKGGNERLLGSADTLDEAKQLAQAAEEARVEADKAREFVDISDILNEFAKMRGEKGENGENAAEWLGYKLRDLNSNVVVFNYKGKRRAVDIDISKYYESKYARKNGSGAKLIGFDRESGGDRQFFFTEMKPTGDANGLASRGSGLSPERERVADAQNEVDRLTRLFGSIYGETFEEDGQMELDDLIDQEMRKQRIGRREATKFARELQKDYLTYSDARNELDDAIIAEEASDMDGERQFADGFASGDRQIETLSKDLPDAVVTELPDGRKRYELSDEVQAIESMENNGDIRTYSTIEELEGGGFEAEFTVVKGTGYVSESGRFGRPDYYDPGNEMELEVQDSGKQRFDTLKEAVKYLEANHEEEDRGRDYDDGFASSGWNGIFRDRRIDPPDDYEPFTSYEGGNGNDAIADYIARKLVRDLNDGSHDWIRELAATEYLPNSEPGSEESNVLRKLAGGEKITVDDYNKLPEMLKDEIDLAGNEDESYADWAMEYYADDRDADGFASRDRLRTAADREDLLVELSDYPDDYDADMSNMAAQDLQNNFARLSADDQNMYFQRALTNNAESGMTAEQILEEAKKLAMDDRRLAELERQSIGEGQSSRPRKIDVSSSSALNSVEYDEMNRRLSVEYRGRDGKGTGTVYTYDGVEPDVVDRIEAADSRGATMREVRDNYEFTTSRKLPESAYEGLASRGGNENISIERGRNGQWVMSAMVTGNRGANEENRGTRRMQYTVVGGSRRDALKAFRDWMDENNVSFDGRDGFASRGGRRSTREMEREFTSLEESDSALGRMNPSEVQEYRQKLIDARNQAALEMIQANGLDPKQIRYADDISPDEDDFGVLERYDMAISDADEHLSRHRRDKSIAEAKQNAAARALGAAEDVAKEVRDGSSERRRNWDSDEEYIQALREDWDSILGVVDTFVSDESEGESLDSMETYTLEHDTYVFDEERQILDGMQARIDSAKTEDDFAQIQTDLDNLMTGLVRSHEERYREDEAYNDYEAPYVPDEDELPSSRLTDFLKNEDADGFASRGNRRRPGRRNQGRKRQGMAPKTRYTDEERQTLADRAILRSRKRPGKRFEGPRASEWDGFASTGLDETYSDTDMPTDRNVVFEGGEHGPGKDISLNKMWENYRSTLPSLAPRRGSRKQPDKWSMTEPLYDQRDEFDPETGLTKKVRRLLVAPATFDEFMERFGPDSSVGLDEASVRALMDSRIPGSTEVFIDDPYLADKISTALGYGPGKNEGLFGFDPLRYFDEAGRPAEYEDEIDAAIASERARRTARLAAREGRLGKRNVIQRRPTQAAGDNRPVGEISLRDLAQKLSKATGRNIALTDDEGNALSPERMRRNLSDAGIDLPWSIQKFRVMKQRQVLPYEYAKDLVNLGILGESDLPERDALTLGEIAQWPGFRERGLNAASVYRALAEVGIPLEPRNARSIEEAFGYAGRGERRRIASRNLRRGSVLVSKAKVREMMERLGLDADEFEKWFSRTDNFTDVPNRPEVTP